MVTFNRQPPIVCTGTSCQTHREAAAVAYRRILESLQAAVLRDRSVKYISKAAAATHREIICLLFLSFIMSHLFVCVRIRERSV